MSPVVKMGAMRLANWGRLSQLESARVKPLGLPQKSQAWVLGPVGVYVWRQVRMRSG